MDLFKIYENNQQISYLLLIFGLMTLSFIIAMAATPFFTTFLYKFKLGKKIRASGATPIFTEMHKGKENTPTMGGLLIWITVALVTLFFNFSRSQTWLPLFCLLAVGIIGAVDDLLNIKGVGPTKGMRARYKLVWQIIIAAVGAWWFYSKLGYNSFHVPAYGDIIIGLWYIPLFIFIIIAASNAVNITDGLDGLAAGLLAPAYGAFAVIAFMQGNYGMAAFAGSVVGALLSFLWFNIYPARFFMGDTGSMALGATLGVLAMLTNSVLVLPIIGFVFVMEAASVIIQVASKKLRHGKKIFKSAPIHHHFEALGWPETKVTMRFWVIGVVTAVIGMVIGLLGRGQ